MKRLFFYTLCIYFLNLVPPAESAGSAAEKFVPPVILNDYNEGLLVTRIGGLSGGDEEAPGRTFATVVSGDNFTRGNYGYSLMLYYDVSGLGEFSFYWIKLGPETHAVKDATKPLDLRGYNYLSLWIRGLAGGEKIKVELHQDADDNGVFVFGKDITSYVYLDGYIPEGRVTRNWQKVLVPLKDFKGITDRSKALELVLVFENASGNTSGSVYLDDILFGHRPDWALETPDIQKIKAPIASSFKVNDLPPEECAAFSRSNDLTIKAESVHENPFLESISFQYSVDKGTIWRTLGADYDVSKNIYNLKWCPQQSCQLHDYRIRAVACDIRGNEAVTPLLIDRSVEPLTDDEFLNLIEEAAFRFFADHQNMETGLFADTTGGGDASIASTGFGITALCVGVKRGWIKKEDASRRIMLAFDTFLPNTPGGETLAEGKYGFFYHFLNMHTGKRAGKAEISTVDTAILVCGALTAGEYFGGEIKKKAEKIYENVQWGEFLCKERGPWYGMFSMGWSPERGFLSSYWDFYTDEVILISLLAIGSPTYPVDPGAFYAWTRHKGAYGEGKPFIYTWHGALFSYQYAHVWFDFRNIADKKGVNWFENSRNATLANRQFCIDHREEFKTYGPDSWGITSMARPTAYTMHFGTPPCGSGEAQYDSTISPTAPAGSIVFTPYLSLSALRHMYTAHPRIWGKYGFRDSFNLDFNWYSNAYYGIGEAMYVLPIENFRSGFIWEKFMKNRHIKEALRKAGFTEKNEKRTE